ncbi:T9SS type B sorting domain-containing protein [Corallibacter sp.]|uniref:T9SS type B sorting domain-containing protein n=1 Tax=Corallibacter sp. TaxID=2038084 RepID=UPI003A8F8EA3
MKKIITLCIILFVNFSFAQLIAIDDVVIGRADNPNAATSSGDRVFLNDYFNGTAINFGTYSNFTITETIPDSSGFTTLNPLGFVNIAANTPQGIYYITYEICENANPTNCDTAEVEIRVFPTTSSSGSGSAEMSISVDSGSISCGGNVCITTAPCVDLSTGTIPPLTLSADYTEVGHSTGYDVRSIPFNPPFSFGETATGTALTADDVWSTPINFAFDFEFYNNDYTQCALSTNGAVGFNLSDAVGAHYWTPAAGALIPNNTDAALMDGNIFGAIHDTDPSASGTLGVDYNITYSVKGEAPFRVFVFSFFNVAQYSTACNSLKTNQMIMFYETTNIIETYIFQKPICPGWAGGRAAIGIQNDAGTDGVSPPGRNTGVWDVSPTGPEAWQFYPNGGAPITSFEWLDDTGTVLGTDPNALVVTPSETTTYIAQVTYTDALTGVERVAYRPITVVVPPTPVVTLSDSPDVCGSGDAIFTITGSENDVVEYNVNGGATQTVTLDATGEHIITITGATSDQTVNLESVDNLNSVCGGPLAISETVQVFTQPNVDTPSDVTACNDYTLPALTEGDYYTGSGGTGTMLNAGDVITTTQTIYVYAESGTTPNCVDEHSFIVTIDSCTLSVTAVADMPSICNDAGADVTLTATPSPGTAVGAYSYSWTEQGDATVLGTASTLVLSPPPAVTTTYEVTLTDSGLTAPNDTATNTVTVTVNNTPTVDAPGDVTMCDTYTLPALTSGDYYTGAGGTGTLLAAGDDITTTQTIYVYGETGTTPNCFDENSFVVTINDTPVVDTPSDVTICDSYTLPALTAGTYYDAAGGTGAVLNAGDTILTTQTIYIYAETGTTPNCTAEHSFTVTVNTTPVVDAPVDVEICDSYTLPALGNGDYYTGSGGTGTMLNAGDSVTTTQTVYVYADTGTTPNCFDENSFVVTINNTPVADAPTDVIACDSYVLPALTVGNYYTGSGGTGTMLNAGDSVTTTQTIYVYAETGTTPNCSDENSFEVTINTTPLADAPADVTECVTYTLPALINGAYYTGAGGTGTMLNAGDSITSTQTIYVYAESGTTPNCINENSFIVTINSLPSVVVPTPLVVCDDTTIDGVTEMDLTVKNDEITGNNSNYNVTYYNSSVAAQNGAPQVAPSDTAYIGTDGEVVYVRVEDVNTGCVNFTTLTLNVTNGPTVAAPADLYYCDPDNDNLGVFDLSLVRDDILAVDPTLNVSFHLTYQNAIDGVNAQGDTLSNVAGQTVYVRVDYGSNSNCPTVVSVNLIVNPTPIVPSTIDDYAICDDDDDGIGSFNLTTMNGDILGSQNSNDFTLTYHETLADAEADPAANPITGSDLTNYQSGNTTIYVRLENDNTECVTIGEFNLVVNPLPVIPVDAEDAIFEICDDSNDNDGYAIFDLTTRNSGLTGGNASYEVDYYETMADIPNNPIPNYSAYANTSVGGLPHNPQTIFATVTETTSGSNCYALTTVTLVVNTLPTPNDALPDLVACDDNNPGDMQEEFVLDQNEALMLNDFDETVTYHESLTEAELGDNEITNLGNYINTSAIQTIYVRVTDTGDPNDANDDGTGCYTIVTFDLIVNPLPEFIPDNPYIICVDTNGTEVIGLPTIDTGLNPLDYTFEWLDENGVIVSIDSSYTPNLAGLYTVEITNSATGCSNIFTTEAVESAPPVLSAEVSTQAFSDPNVIVATVTGTGDYEFSIDNGPWLGDGSNSYTFTDVRFGEHLIMARDANGCGISTDTVFVLDYPLFFTPNNDGDNDTWQISGIDNQPDAKIYIFDRYGKLLKQLNPTGSGWDGTLNGKPLPSSDYWFTIEYREPSDDSRKQFQAHFTLKR